MSTLCGSSAVFDQKVPISKHRQMYLQMHCLFSVLFAQFFQSADVCDPFDRVRTFVAGHAGHDDQSRAERKSLPNCAARWTMAFKVDEYAALFYQVCFMEHFSVEEFKTFVGKRTESYLQPLLVLLFLQSCIKFPARMKLPAPKKSDTPKIWP
jgi:hypothetical protein